MRVLLLAVNARFTHSNLAIRYLRDAILDACRGHEVILREYYAAQNELEIIEDVVSSKPDVLLCSSYIWNTRLLESILPDLHALMPAATVILGGPEAGYDAERWLAKFDFVSMVVSGPGEAAIALLARCGFDAEHDSLSPYLSAAKRSRSRVLAVPSPDFGTIPFPYREGDWPALEGKYLYYESSRGCPFACAYCVSSRKDQSLSAKPASVVKAELAEILSRGPRIIKFVDRTFNADPARAREIWEFCARDTSPVREVEGRKKPKALRSTAEGGAGGDLVMFHFEVHPALLEEEDFALLETVEPGRFQFEIGIQSTNSSTLSAVNRPVGFDAIAPAVSRLMASGRVHVHLDLIAGLPGEDMESLGRSFDRVMELKPQHLQLGFLKALPGTAIREDADGANASGLVYRASAPYQILRNRWLSAEDISELRLMEALLDSMYNEGVGKERMRAMAPVNGGHFAAWRSFASCARENRFDVRTRNAEKLESLLRIWGEAAPEGSSGANVVI